MDAEASGRTPPYTSPEDLAKFERDLEVEQKVALVRPPTEAKMSPELRKRIGELRYFAGMNRASKTLFWRARYGIPGRLYHLAPILAPGEMPVDAALWLMKEAESVGELRFPDEKTKEGKRNKIKELGLAELHSSQKKKISRTAREEWEVAVPSGGFLIKDANGKPFKCEGVRYWKAEYDSSLTYAPIYGHTHGIVPWRSLKAEDLLQTDVKFDTLVNALCEVIYDSLRLKGHNVADVPITRIPLADIYKMGCPTAKTQLTYLFSTAGRRSPAYYKVFFTNQQLIDLHANNRDEFYELMARLSVMLHRVAFEMDFRSQDMTLHVKQRLISCDRDYDLYNWKRFSDMFSVSNMKAHHYIFLASSHPYFTHSSKLIRNDKARFYFTAAELDDLCSAVETTEATYRNAPRTYADTHKRVFDKEALRVTWDPIVRKAVPQGYFIGRSFSSLVDPDREPLQAEYAQWLRHTYESAFLLRRKDQPLSDLPEAVAYTAEQEARDEAFFFQVCEQNTQFIGEEQSDRIRFKKWLYDRAAPNKTDWEGQAITFARFAGMDELEQESLIYGYFGYRSSENFGENKAAIHNIKMAEKYK
jgi:hypothetical protein